jgi:hypothetical protein
VPAILTPDKAHRLQLRSQVYTGSVGVENFTYFVAHPAKNSENLFFTSRRFGWIVKTPVVAFHHPGKYRTGLVDVSAYRDHGMYFRIEEFLEVLRTVPRNIDPNLFQERWEISSSAPLLARTSPQRRAARQVAAPENGFLR